MSHLILTGLTRTAAIIPAARPVLLRGKGRPGATVTASLGNKPAESTRVSDDGRWAIRLPSLPAGGPYRGAVESDGQSIPLEDIHAGEVWLCSGQSNMQMSLAGIVKEERPTLGAYPLVRSVVTARKVSVAPLQDVAGNWVVTDSDQRAGSAVGFHFARTLHERLGVPVGIVQSAVGHTPAMAWTPRRFIAPCSAAAGLLSEFDRQLQDHPGAAESLDPFLARLMPGFDRWNKAVSAWQPEARKRKAAGLAFDPIPDRETGFADPHTPTLLFNGMVAPYAEEHFTGVLWYQGETDAMLGYADEYPTSLRLLIEGWRHVFECRLPFVVVQLPRHDDIQCPEPDNRWATLRQAQAGMISDPGVAVVQTLDLGDTDRIHPIRKMKLAIRAADCALHLAYGQPGHRHGPMLSSITVDGSTTRLTFSAADSGLNWTGSQNPSSAQIQTTRDGVNWTAAYPTRVWQNHVEITSDPGTTAIRYGWACDPMPSLFDGKGTPASGFVASMNAGAGVPVSAG